MQALLRHLLANSPPAPPEPSIDAWWDAHEATRARFDRPFDLAAVAGFASDRLAFAFASGYAAALSHILPDPTGKRRALCVTEASGNRPRDVRTTLVREGQTFRLSGEKTFVTMGSAAEELLIVARELGPGESLESRSRPKLAVVRVPRDRVGVVVEERDPTSFMPEIPHAAVRLAGVRITDEDRVPGDGYLEVVKPFRTVEDIHVHAAVIGLFLRFGRENDWSHGVIERLVAALVALRGVSEIGALEPVAHVALAGVLESMGRFVDAELPKLAERLPIEDRERLFRDAALFGIANKARGQRRLSAWASLLGR